MNEQITIGLAGDVMLGRLVNERISLTNYTYSWGDVLEDLRSTSLNIANLENAFTTSTKAVQKAFNYKADPDKVQALVEARFGVVNLANNHILDFSEDGLLETIDVLDKAGILHVGAGRDEAEAMEPVIVERNGVSIGIIGCTDNEPGWKAGKDSSGVYFVDVHDAEGIIEQIRSLRKLVDILILTMHWGPNMVEVPSEDFRKFAHEAVDAGVDIFHGHSSHLFQGIEVYRKKVILYDAGDFIDDYDVDPYLRNDHAFFFVVEAGKKGISRVRLLPMLISYLQVTKAYGDDSADAVSRLKKLSEMLGTNISETDKGIFIDVAKIIEAINR